MHLGKRITIGLTAVAVAEVAAFILAAMAIGVAAALALMALTSLAGARVLRRVGGGGIAQFRVAGGDAGRHRTGQGDRRLAAPGGILLALPGFITDMAGAARSMGASTVRRDHSPRKLCLP